MNLVQCNACDETGKSMERYVGSLPAGWVEMERKTKDKDSDGDHIFESGHLCPECFESMKSDLGFKLIADE